MNAAGARLRHRLPESQVSHRQFASGYQSGLTEGGDLEDVDMKPHFWEGGWIRLVFVCVQVEFLGVRSTDRAHGAERGYRPKRRLLSGAMLRERTQPGFSSGSLFCTGVSANAVTER